MKASMNLLILVFTSPQRCQSRNDPRTILLYFLPTFVMASLISMMTGCGSPSGTRLVLSTVVKVFYTIMLLLTLNRQMLESWHTMYIF